MFRGFRIGVLGVCLSLVVACRHVAPDPAEAVRSFAAAIERGDHEKAYGLMSDRYRARVSLREFRSQLQAQQHEVATVVPALRRLASDPPLRVEVQVQPDIAVPLVREGAGWRIDDQPFDFLNPRTPRAALRAFVTALDHRDYDRLLFLAPDKRRAGMSAASLQAYWEGERTEAHKKLLTEIRRQLDAPIIQDGDRAFLPLLDNTEVRFTREDGIWKVEAAQ